MTPHEVRQGLGHSSEVTRTKSIWPTWRQKHQRAGTGQVETPRCDPVSPLPNLVWPPCPRDLKARWLITPHKVRQGSGHTNKVTGVKHINAKKISPRKRKGKFAYQPLYLPALTSYDLPAHVTSRLNDQCFPMRSGNGQDTIVSSPERKIRRCTSGPTTTTTTSATLQPDFPCSAWYYFCHYLYYLLFTPLADKSASYLYYLGIFCTFEVTQLLFINLSGLKCDVKTLYVFEVQGNTSR